MGCNKCEKNSTKKEKSTHRTQEEKRNLIKRLNIIEGQVRGIKQMIEDDRYCDDVLIQISAVNKAVQTIGNRILENHMKTCVVRDIQNGNVDIVEDVMKLINKLQ